MLQERRGWWGVRCKGPGHVTELALPSLSTRSPHTLNSAEETWNVRCSSTGLGCCPLQYTMNEKCRGTPVPWGRAHIGGSRGWNYTFCVLCVRAGEEGWLSKVIPSQAETKLPPIWCSSAPAVKAGGGWDMGRAPEVHTDTWSCGCHLISVSHR